MNAFYLIDKPLGVSSFFVIKVLRKKLNTSRIGHTGTLDPLATGGLLIAVGEYTKLIPYIENETKEYEFQIGLDGTTESFDLEKEVEYLSEEKQKYYEKNLGEEDIEKILREKFIGQISQIPPKYSAIKIKGQKALHKIKNNEVFDIKPREVKIDDIKIIEYNYPDLLCRATVSKGTYIRSIANDLGEIIGTGGYIKTLRRTKIGQLNISIGQILDDFDRNKKIDPYLFFGDEKIISLSEEEIIKLNQGLFIDIGFDLKNIGNYFIRNKVGDITNVVKYEKGELRPVRNLKIENNE